MATPKSKEECFAQLDKELSVEDKQYLIENEGVKKNVPGSISFVPSVAGLMLAGEVIRDIISK